MSSSLPVEVTLFTLSDRLPVQELLHSIGWQDSYVTGQLEAITNLAEASQGSVFVARSNRAFAGYVSIEFYSWNRLSQLHGLVVDPVFQRRGIAAELVQRAEMFARELGARGVYVDTPVTNTGATQFYISQGYIQDYIMTDYYDEGLNGVTYLKKFTAPLA